MRRPVKVKIGDQEPVLFFGRQATSVEAALSLADHVSGMERDVLGLLDNGLGGLTCEEVEARLDMSHQTASARIRGLAIKGLIKDSGNRRLTKSGRRAIVWEVA